MYAIRSYYACQKFGEEITPSIYKEQFVSFQAEIFDKDFSLKAGNYEIAAKYAYVLTQVFVITSYSIHYTKLYDFSGFLIHSNRL